MRPDPRAAHRHTLLASLALLAVLSLATRALAGEPTVDQMLALRRAGSPVASPDGRFVAYTVRDTDMVGNAYVTQLWLADVAKRTVRPLTFGTKSNTAPAWSPDGAKLAFLSERTEKRQVWWLDMRGGEPEKLTAADEGVTAFAWSPDGGSVAYTAPEGKDDVRKDRDKRYGELERDSDRGGANLWLHTLGGARGKRLTTGGWAVSDFGWSPDGKRIAFDHQAHDALAADSTKEISVVDVANGRVTPLVTWRSPDAHPVWSPDGTRIAFETAAEDPAWYYANGMIAVVPADGGPPSLLTRGFDEDVSLVAWTPAGIWFAANMKTAAYLYRLDPGTGVATRLAPAEGWTGSGWNLTRDGGFVTYLAGDAAHYPEVFMARVGEPGIALTRLSDQLAGWTLGTSEVVAWTSRDGTRIEGVLRKPPGWRPGSRRPLLVMIHGGPTGVSRPTRFAATYVYPVEHWLAKGALVLEPNYRGSAGYGAAFRALNVRNLGVGDAWDVVSGIESLARAGLVDSTRVGVMGWSQGGYISAFLATHESRRFKAISVGAGISDWMTYYANTDITPFTPQYLKATPWDDPAIYATTSPITTVRSGARTPVLIQHGGADARVPTPNARELYRALVDVGVETRLTVFPGFGHGLNKPKAIRAAMEENRDWFDRLLFGPATAGAASNRR
ncbi:MAG TPA: S9 family peptidase [Candidatus Eisenbacteria bacterium]|jgi:dipeptidyl aminopeptidase/acylaminoacyl peptidase